MIIAITPGKTEASEESPELVLGREVWEVQTGDDKTAIFNICFDFGEHFSGQGLLIGVGKAFIRYDYCTEGRLGNGSERGGRGLHAPEGGHFQNPVEEAGIDFVEVVAIGEREEESGVSRLRPWSK